MTNEIILASNTLEHKGFPKFLIGMAEKHPASSVYMTGDLLNIFPEPGEDLEGSMHYEIFGDVLKVELDRLVGTGFQNIHESVFIEHLNHMFQPFGKHYDRCHEMGWKRYETMFSAIDDMMSAFPDFSLVVVPGNMDYPDMLRLMEAKFAWLKILDGDFITINGVSLAGVGGNPNNLMPFRGSAEISPYEMAPAEYLRRLKRLKKSDVLLTHVTAMECDLLMSTFKESSIKMVISRAPFNFKAEPGNYRGALQVNQFEDKRCVSVRPFDYPRNEYFVLHVGESLDLKTEIWEG